MSKKSNKSTRSTGRVTPVANSEQEKKRLDKQDRSLRLQSMLDKTKVSRLSYVSNYENILTKATESNQLNTDNFKNYYSLTVGGTKVALEPIYPFNQLLQIFIDSNTLRQCANTLVTNVESYGFMLEYIGEEGKESEKDVQAEKEKLYTTVRALNGGDSFETARENARWDYEATGNRAWEIIRNNKQEVVGMFHVPIYSLRMTAKDEESTKYTFLTKDENGNYVENTSYKKFRTYLQTDPVSAKNTYFKEFGDPRKISAVTGKPIELKEGEDGVAEEEATEILYDAMYVPGSIYGLPRWIGALPAILGSREADLVNLAFFRENAIPALVVTVSGGTLTEDAFLQLENFFASNKGRNTSNKVLLLEATSDDSMGTTDSTPTAPKVDFKPMTSERQTDALFKEYDELASQKVRSTFQLAPIFLGRSQDYTRASAFASIVVTENQVFSPERTRFDRLMNDRILVCFKPKYWRFKSLGSPIADAETVSTLIKSLGKEGALTPNAVIKLANKMLDIDIKPVIDEWGDTPFALVMQHVKNGGTVKGLTDFIDKFGAKTQLVDSNGAVVDPNTSSTETTTKKEVVDETEENIDNKEVIKKLIQETLSSELNILLTEIKDILKEEGHTA